LRVATAMDAGRGEDPARGTPAPAGAREGAAAGAGGGEPVPEQAQAEELTAEQQEKVANDAEEEIAWRVNAPLLYDLFIDCTMDWPALAIDWLPDEDDQPCRLAIGLHTDGSAPHEVIIAQLECDSEETMEVLDPWHSWHMPGIGDMEGFGCTVDAATGAAAPLRPLARLMHPTEVNRVAPCPNRAQLLATKAATGAVLLFDYLADRPAGTISPDATLLPREGKAVDGFALDWGVTPGSGRVLASGGNDGRLCLWEAERASGGGTPTAPFMEVASAHVGALCSLAWARAVSSPLAESLATVGDDGFLRLWDRRANTAATLHARVSADEVLAVAWNHHQGHLLAVAGKDKDVCVWDARTLKEPLHRLKGHDSDVVAVKWAPFRDGLLASCSGDQRLNLWDLTIEESAEDTLENGTPELLFSHAGHGGGVSDFAWSGTDDYLMCSVSEDNGLHIWQPSSEVYMPEDKHAGEETDPPPKRPRTDGAA